MKPTSARLATALLETANRYVGMMETVSNARFDDPKTQARDLDKDVWLRSRMAQVNGWEPGLPYCAGFVGAVVMASFKELGLPTKKFSSLWTAHCMTNYRAFLKQGLIHTWPTAGSIWLCQQGQTDSGHTGFVEELLSSGKLQTIEGNTSPGSKDNTGDGICRRVRDKEKNGKLITRGFIHPEHLLKLI